MKKTIFLLSAATFVAVPLANRGDAVQSRPTPTIEHRVMPGETLWELAAAIPGVDDRREAVHRLIVLNDLPNGSLQAGQTIRIPAPRKP
jgi:predicted Zn-dependent protease